MPGSKDIRTEMNERGEQVITLCGGKDCCPTVTIDRNRNYVIKDDFGGTVILSQEQFDMLKGL